MNKARTHWTDEQVAVLTAYAHLPASQLVKLVNAQPGLPRTEASLRTKRKNLRQERDAMRSYRAHRTSADKKGWPSTPPEFSAQNRKFLIALLDAARREGLLISQSVEAA